MGRDRRNMELDESQRAEAERIYEHLRQNADGHLRELAELLASKPDEELFGETEFQARDVVRKIGADAYQAALDERQKKGRVRGC